jgi:hypothetical protein
MSGREIGVAAGLMIVAIGALSEAASHPGAPAHQLVHVTPRPGPAHTVIVHEVTTRVVTRVVSGSPLAGWELMFIVIAAILVAAGTAIALHSRRQPLWPCTSMT